MEVSDAAEGNCVVNLKPVGRESAPDYLPLAFFAAAGAAVAGFFAWRHKRKKPSPVASDEEVI